MGRCKVDLSKIAFPTDALTLGDLRKQELHSYEPVTIVEEGFPRTRIYRAIGWQGILAHKAYDATANESEPYPAYKRDEIVKALDEVYQEWRLSTGTHASMEMIRRIETAAQDQAIRNNKRK